MTDAQEAILDRLMVEEVIGVKSAGPLGLAGKALQPRSQEQRGCARTLGYPTILRQALNAANEALTGTDERRKFAITFFSGVAPRRKAPSLNSIRHIEVALWAGLRIHPLVCRADCPCAQDIQADASVFLTTGRLRAILTRRPPTHCPALVMRDYSDEELRISAEYSAFLSLTFVLEAAWRHMGRRWPLPSACGAARCAARVTALVEGATGASDFCLALAREVGLKP
jgi:hypothetical protein